MNHHIHGQDSTTFGVMRTFYLDSNVETSQRQELKVSLGHSFRMLSQVLLQVPIQQVGEDAHAFTGKIKVIDHCNERRGVEEEVVEKDKI